MVNSSRLTFELGHSNTVLHVLVNRECFEKSLSVITQQNCAVAAVFEPSPCMGLFISVLGNDRGAFIS